MFLFTQRSLSSRLWLVASENRGFSYICNRTDSTLLVEYYGENYAKNNIVYKLKLNYI